MRVPYAGSSAELFKFSPETMEWTDLSAAGVVKGTMPSARSGHAMTAVGKDIYLSGGYAAAGEEEGHLKVAVRRSRRSLAPIT